MKQFFLGVLVIVMMICTTQRSYAQRYAHGNIHINQGGYRSDMHVWGRAPYYNYNNYYGYNRGIAIPGYGYLRPYYYNNYNTCTPVIIAQPQPCYYETRYILTNGMYTMDAYGNYITTQVYVCP